MDVNEELNFFVKIKKKNLGGGRGSGWGGGVGYGGCEPRVEGIVQGTKRYCTILRK